MFKIFVIGVICWLLGGCIGVSLGDLIIATAHADEVVQQQASHRRVSRRTNVGPVDYREEKKNRLCPAYWQAKKEFEENFPAEPFEYPGDTYMSVPGRQYEVPFLQTLCEGNYV